MNKTGSDGAINEGEYNLQRAMRDTHTSNAQIAICSVADELRVRCYRSTRWRSSSTACLTQSR